MRPVWVFRDSWLTLTDVTEPPMPRSSFSNRGCWRKRSNFWMPPGRPMREESRESWSSWMPGAPRWRSEKNTIEPVWMRLWRPFDSVGRWVKIRREPDEDGTLHRHRGGAGGDSDSGLW